MLLYLALTRMKRKRDSSVGVRFPARARDSSPLHILQKGSGFHPASYQMGTGGFCSGVKRQGRETDNLPACSAEVIKNGAIPPLPHSSSWNRAQLSARTILLLL
jgi:hypothetical protein